MKLFDFFKGFGKFKIGEKGTKEIGIDLGTANTVVYVKGEGIQIDEPTYVTINVKTEEIDFIGEKAKEIIGRTAKHTQVIRPLKNGVISDYEITERMLSEFVKETGAKEVYLIEEPVAAAIGAGIDMFEPKGHLIVDIGGGTTEIAFIVSGGSAAAKSIKIAGDHFNDDIIEYVKEKHNVLIGERTAEMLKEKTISSKDRKIEIENRGRELGLGLPKSIKVTAEEMDNAIRKNVDLIIEEIKLIIEEIEPEIASDIYETGICLSGGGAGIVLLKEKIEKELKLNVTVSEQPIYAVINGIAKVLDDFDAYKNIIITPGFEY